MRSLIVQQSGAPDKGLGPLRQVCRWMRFDVHAMTTRLVLRNAVMNGIPVTPSLSRYFIHFT